MNKGKWYLVYTYLDRSGSSLRNLTGGDTKYEEIPLKATNEGDAIVEAKSVWETKVREAKKNWRTAKKICTKPPKTAFENGPWKPRVVYQFLLL